MQRFGSIYKKFRQDKGFSRKYATDSEAIMTVQALGRFESNQSDITVERLNLLLQQIFISWKELIQAAQASEMDNIDVFDKKMNQFIYENNLQKMKDTALDLQEKFDLTQASIHQHFSILTEIIVSFFDPEKQVQSSRIQIIKDHLSAMEYWSEYENYLFSSIIFLFEPEDVELLLPRVMKKMVKNSPTTEDAHNNPYALLNNVTSYFMRRKNYPKALNITQVAKSMMNDNEGNFLFDKILMKYNEGIIQFYLGQKEALEDCQRYIDALDLIGGYTGVVATMSEEVKQLKNTAKD